MRNRERTRPGILPMVVVEHLCQKNIFFSLAESVESERQGRHATVGDLASPISQLMDRGSLKTLMASAAEIVTDIDDHYPLMELRARLANTGSKTRCSS